MTAHSHQTGLVSIALSKVMKGLLLLMVGLGLLELMHADLATLFSRLIEALHLNADSRIIHALVLRIDALQPHSVLVASLVGLGYAGLFLVEGIGLWFVTFLLNLLIVLYLVVQLKHHALNHT
ncbi:MAG: DUF2127 domain-containing protein [Nitrospira sp.]|nr:DUF2127 domain-containing protein [Nitrospira sp.]